jgi:hypothetical protein
MMNKRNAITESRKKSMNDVEHSDSVLQPHMQALKQQLDLLTAPSQIEVDLLMAFDKQFPKRAWWQVWGNLQWRITGGVAASILAVLVLVKNPISPNLIYPSGPSQTEADLYEDIPFVALNSGEAILKQDSMRIVQAEIPHTMLASMGMAVNPQVAAGYSRAEMLVGANDEYLALRFLPN